MSLRQCLLVCLLLFNVLDSELDCTSTDTNTCFIDLSTPLNDNNRDNITCSDSIPNCAISCNTRDSCSTNIICPPDGDLCTIHCKTLHSCSDSTVITGNCTTVSVNIDGNTQSMQINAPDDSGSLSINISAYTFFQHNTIMAPSHTNNIRIHCEGDCSENTIHALSISGGLNLNCLSSTSQCDMNTIYCPRDCSIFCNECPDTNLIMSTTADTDHMEWICDTDCTNASLSTLQNDDTWMWQQCASDGWVLSDTECDTGDTVQTTATEEDGANNETITILAFVLIGTVIGCLCVILVTTIICCICWHESQIKALNMGDNTNSTTNNNNHSNPPNAIQPHDQQISSRGATPPSFPGDDSTTPAPQSVSVPVQQPINVYKPARRSYSPEAIPVIAPPKKRVRKKNSYKTQPHPKTARDRVVYQQPPQQPSASSSGEQNLQSGPTGTSGRSTNHRNSNHRRSSGRNSSNNKTRSRSPPQRDEAIHVMQTIQDKIKVKMDEAQQTQSQALAAEADDDLYPLKNDRIGARYDEHGHYNKYQGRKERKDALRMQLAAFPSNISAGTTGTAEMNFVGTNYNEYNPADQNNSYFKEDGYEHTVGSGGTTVTSTTALSLGNLDSQSSDPTSDPSTEPLTPTTVTSVTSTAITSPDINMGKQYQGHHGHYQGHNNMHHAHAARDKRNIQIIEPQNTGQKVKQHQYNIQRDNANPDSMGSPTLTYSSPENY